ncbi:phosphomannose isomerase type II C-terminal cupin domain [Candidatus Woesearchaeota archaeon]|jgi:mannose-6-phosphate isomerase|nr:phosphomannose isomerase type II C-terminal cupin domain [Candidatus Woesearchaeota archaeon]MBT5342166.1 phosphomannose isomerase type II C-terminal cupin domain [Candidatus Woesearchaeota archaeon]MBT6774519.1 phosphomannose isomerase type II C-terminal cupin domain [Candidatus Woesearchaeota archaeon]
MKPFVIKKPWGEFIQFTHDEKSTVKILVVKPNEILSLQSHNTRAEFWYVIEGTPHFVTGKSTKKYKAGDSVKVAKKTKHRIINKSKKLVRVLEISTGIFDENDIIRYEDKYQRVKK